MADERIRQLEAENEALRITRQVPCLHARPHGPSGYLAVCLSECMRAGYVLECVQGRLAGVHAHMCARCMHARG